MKINYKENEFWVTLKLYIHNKNDNKNKAQEIRQTNKKNMIIDVASLSERYLTAKNNSNMPKLTVRAICYGQMDTKRTD